MARIFKVTAKETNYESPWLVVKDYAITKDGQPANYRVVERSDAVIIAAVTPDNRRLLSQSDIHSMVASGEISDGFTLAALALLDIHSGSGRL
jgi:hypothetical protein